MKLHQFGKNNEKVVVMIHGACMSWDMLKDSINLLKTEYHVIAVAVPGHDLTTDEEFTGIESIAERIENMMMQGGYDTIDCLYGLAMGGGIAIRMLADNKLKIKNAIVDGGITPYEMPYLQSKLLLAQDVAAVEVKKRSRHLMNLTIGKNRYDKKYSDRMYEVMHHMSSATIKRVCESTGSYSMPETFPEVDTKIYYWHGGEEKKDRKLDIEYVEKHIPGVIIEEIPEMEQGEFVLMNPEEFVQKVKEIIEAPEQESAEA